MPDGKTGSRTILVTGFSGFPGMPYNPTERFIRRLEYVDVPLNGGRLVAEVLPVSWQRAPKILDALIDVHQPGAIILFGVAGRSTALRVETRAVNRATRLLPDADGQLAASRRLDAEAGRYLTATLPTRDLKHAAQRTGCRAVLSRDAGSYLCNAMLWRAVSSGIPSVFVHWPMPYPARPRSGATTRKPDFERLETASRAILRAVLFERFAG